MSRVPQGPCWDCQWDPQCSADLFRLDQLAHRHRGVRHAIGKSPLIVVPAQNAHQCAVDDLGLGEVEGGRIGVVIEVEPLPISIYVLPFNRVLKPYPQSPAFPPSVFPINTLPAPAITE